MAVEGTSSGSGPAPAIPQHPEDYRKVKSVVG